MHTSQFSNFLMGCALGDALGRPVEGYTKRKAPIYYDKLVHGFSWLDRLFYGFNGQVTDDTQMTICLAQTLIDLNFFDEEDYMRRLCTLYREKRIMGIGRATQQALETYIKSRDIGNCGAPQGQAGNGAAMRTGLLGLWYKQDDDIIRQSIKSAQLTHRDSRSIAAAVVMALVANKLAHSKLSVPEILMQVSILIESMDPTVSQLLLKIPSLVGLGLDSALAQIVTLGYNLPSLADPNLILGISGFAPTSIGWVLLCLVSYPDDIDAALRLLFSGGGDLDTNASMLCSLLLIRNELNLTLRRYEKYIHDGKYWQYSFLYDLGDQLRLRLSYYA